MKVRQAANVIELLEFFAERLRPATAAEIADGLGWPRSSTFNLVGTLAELGYLYEPRGRGGLYPTSRWLSIAQAVSEAELLPEALLRLVARVAAETGETTLVGAVAGLHAIVMHVVESEAPIRYFAAEGKRLPIHSCATGWALLSQLSAAQRKALYKRIGFEAYTPQSPLDPDAVEALIAQGTARGYFLSDGEFSPHLVGVSVPLAVDGRQLAISVAGPQFRCLDRAEAFAGIVKAAMAQAGFQNGR
jgi:DNA-binding IclR family transcriptional regulator